MAPVAGVTAAMIQKKSKSDIRNPKIPESDLNAIWTAACHIAQRKKESPFGETMRAALAPFIDAAIEVALAMATRSGEDLRPLLHRARMHLEEAKLVLPSIADHAPISAKAAESWQRMLVRHALSTSREFCARRDTPTAPDIEMTYEPYTTMAAGQLEEPDPSKLWLVEQIWQRAGTGIVGGSAKGAKTWLCLDLALSVASGTPVLDRFAVHRPGGVLFVSAEGGQAYLRERLNALCAHRGLNIDSLPHALNIIPTAIRIDTQDGLGRLNATIEASRPVLVVLDPFVRLHRIDENSASSVSRLLSTLTELQQAHDLAIVMAHHATKQGGRRSDMGGQDFRGSSDIYAWGDSNVFLRRKGHKFVLAAEHRAAPATEKWTMEATAGASPRLQIIEDGRIDAGDEGAEGAALKLENDILDLLRSGAKSVREVRATVKGGNERIGESIRKLEVAGRITRVGSRWTLANGSAPRD